ncbi:MAG TPA: hypothetical protein VJ279_01060 [Hanamia sp.]|nr:hypothetical protein [Hanamia sp.]
MKFKLESNTLKHAQADTLKIKLFTEKGKLIILTADDVGFSEHEDQSEGYAQPLWRLLGATYLFAVFKNGR